MMMLRTFRYVFEVLWSVPRTLYAFFFLSKIKQPCITIFGGTHVRKESIEYKQAYDAGKLCAQKGYGVITGGGAGIMEAALCGAIDYAGKNAGLGIGVSGVDEKFISLCRSRVVMVSNLEIRKQFLTQYSQGFIVFPGGIGTLNEFTEVINLIKLDKLKSAPVILVGTEYWNSIILWLELAAQERLFLLTVKEHIMITDDIEFAVSFATFTHNA
jgi:uncharacterized protein (TIGR00730 family)